MRLEIDSLSKKIRLRNIHGERYRETHTDTLCEGSRAERSGAEWRGVEGSGSGDIGSGAERGKAERSGAGPSGAGRSGAERTGAEPRTHVSRVFPGCFLRCFRGVPRGSGCFLRQIIDMALLRTVRFPMICWMGEVFPLQPNVSFINLNRGTSWRRVTASLDF